MIFSGFWQNTLEISTINFLMHLFISGHKGVWCVWILDVFWGMAALRNRCDTGNHLTTWTGKSTIWKDSNYSLAAFKWDEKYVASSRAILIASGIGWESLKEEYEFAVTISSGGFNYSFHNFRYTAAIQRDKLDLILSSAQRPRNTRKKPISLRRLQKLLGHNCLATTLIFSKFRLLFKIHWICRTKSDI